MYVYLELYLKIIKMGIRHNYVSYNSISMHTYRLVFLKSGTTDGYLL